MAESKVYSASKHLVADPDESGEVTLFEVPPAKKFKGEYVEVYYPRGTAGELELWIMYGESTVMPNEGHYSGDGNQWRDESGTEWTSGVPVKVGFDNTNTTESREGYLLFIGTLEGS